MYPGDPNERRGRPITGSEEKSKELKIRIEPSLYEALSKACEAENITVSHGVRTGIMLFIKVIMAKHKR